MMAAKFKQIDNTTLESKLSMRLAGLTLLDEPPVIMETHGGLGEVYQHIYHEYTGVVFEKDPDKAISLALQRPKWAVYEADCEKALALGAGAHLEVNFLDVDPYGSPWPTFKAFFESKRPFAPKLILAVNDGFRFKIRTGAAWEVHFFRPVVERFGNDLWPVYLQICEWFLPQICAPAGYKVTRFHGRYTGDGQKMTHYLAVLER